MKSLALFAKSIGNKLWFGKADFSFQGLVCARENVKSRIQIQASPDFKNKEIWTSPDFKNMEIWTSPDFKNKEFWTSPDLKNKEFLTSPDFKNS